MVARLHAPKRMRTLTGASARIGESGAVCPLVYYAVRDPSLVRVIPVKHPPLPNGSRHVKLAFQVGMLPGLPVLVESIRRTEDPATLESTNAFVMTIGLPVNDEDAFYQRGVAADPQQDFTDLYTRFRELGRRDT